MTPKKKSDVEYVTVSIRFPRAIYDLLLRTAKQSGRSFNQQVIQIVKVFFEIATGDKDVYTRE